MVKISTEDAWTSWLKRRHRPPAGGVGIGDDAALLNIDGRGTYNHVGGGRGWLIAATTDWFLEGVHFLRSERPEDCGYRLAMRALSDLAAMGAEPMALLLSAAWDTSVSVSWRRRLHAGLEEAAREAGIKLVGGDMTIAERMAFDIVGLGRVRRGRALLRSGARPGDRLWVSGGLGYAAWGRQLQTRAAARNRRAETRSEAERRAIERSRRPRARWELGRRLAAPGLASAGMDLSDGLSSDIHRLCRAGGVGALVEAVKLPCPSGPGGLQFALHGGEDYELLFTAPAAARRRILRLATPALPLTEVGEITAAPGVWLLESARRRRLQPGGWDALRAVHPRNG